MLQELEKVKQELAEARQAMLEGRGQEAELQRQMEERLEREKQKRIEHTQEMALRRIGKRELARGWLAWSGRTRAQAAQAHAQQAASQRLLRPKLMGAYSKWRRDWEIGAAREQGEHERVEERMGQQLLETQAVGARTRRRSRRRSAAGFGGARSRGASCRPRSRSRARGPPEAHRAHASRWRCGASASATCRKGWVAWHDMYVEKVRRA